MTAVIDRDVRVPMRDGTTLATDVYRPSGERSPVLLARTPYGTDLPPLARPAHGMRLVDAGYALALQDVRGRGRSDGTFVPFAQEPQDGADTLAWLRTQRWCDGRVGMLGGSYLGQLQWSLAAHDPRALQALAPHVADPRPSTWFWTGGALEWGFLLHWALSAHALPAAIRRDARGEPGPRPDDVIALIEGIDELYRRGPARLPRLLDDLAPDVRVWTDAAHALRAVDDDLDVARIGVPSLTIAGWHDVFCTGSLRAYAAARAAGTPARLLVGPWSHTVWGGAYPERDYGVRASMDAEDVTAHHLAWFDRWLRDAPDDGRPPVRCFVMGEDAWHDLPAWPPPGVRDEGWLLDLGATATGSLLVPSARPERDAVAELRVDPIDPVPTLGGQTLLAGTYVGRRAGPWDQHTIECRSDVVSLTSAVLADDVRIAGAVRAELFVSSSAAEVDVAVKLVDVSPDGRAEHIADGVRRLAAAAGPGGAPPLAPGELRRVDVEVGSTAMVFRAGHRLRVEVAGANFPRFDLPATGAVVHTRVHSGPSHPSRLVLPRWRS